MSKTHVAENDSDIDAALDAFIAGKKTNPVVSQPSSGVDLFADAQPVQKKKSFLQRLLAHLSNPFSSKRRSLT